MIIPVPYGMLTSVPYRIMTIPVPYRIISSIQSNDRKLQKCLQEILVETNAGQIQV